MGARVAIAMAAIAWASACGAPAAAHAQITGAAPPDPDASVAMSPELNYAQACTVDVAIARPDKSSSTAETLGAGFVVDADQGLVLTAAHLLTGRDAILVVDADLVARSATVASASSKTDIALLRVLGGMPCELTFAQENPFAGQAVHAFSHHPPDLSASHGTIAEVSDQHASDQYFVLDFVLKPGGSGAPIVDDQGHVVGMAIVIVSKSGEKLAFGIPARYLLPVIAAEQLKN